SGHRILLFSQFTSMLALIETELERRGHAYRSLTGTTRNRGELVQAFQDGEFPLFLISLKAGGTGLNLTAADAVIHYDPWWNPAAEAQATDRAHRIGQDQPVFVYKLIAENTVEAKILELQKKKGRLAASLLDDEAAAADTGFTEEEILGLFES
ncbi:MAG: DEAD/DEAH box helicase, partial [Verrucomicrobiota bacterium]